MTNFEKKRQLSITRLYMTPFARVILMSLLINTSSSFATKPFDSKLANLNVSLNHFQALSCDTTGDKCTAVGFDDPAADEPTLMVYQSQDAGLTWSTPIKLAKAPSSTEIATQKLATDIHCDASAQRCFIISSAKVKEDVVLLVYNNSTDQQNWSQPTILPLPKSNLQKQGRYIYAKLACNYSGSSCLIAGTLRVDYNSTPLLYSTKDAGNTWKSLASSLKKPSYTYKNGISLFNVSCDNAGFSCKAVGYAITRNSYWSSYYSSKPVVYTTKDSGVHWSSPLVLPSDIYKHIKNSALNDVKCDEAGLRCIALGLTSDSTTNETRFYSFTTINGGVNWKNKQWINSDSAEEFLSSIDCDNTMLNCTAVGVKNILFVGGSYPKGLIYSTTAETQTWERNVSQPFSAFSYLTDIFCSKYKDQCVAVGGQEMTKPTIQVSAFKKQRFNTYELLQKLPTVTGTDDVRS